MLYVEFFIIIGDGFKGITNLKLDLSCHLEINFLPAQLAIVSLQLNMARIVSLEQV